MNKATADRLVSQAYAQYQTALIKYCTVRLKYNKNAVEDCVQNTFLVYYKRLLAGEAVFHVAAFLYKTADNHCKQADTRFLRHAKRTVDIEEVAALPATESDTFSADLDYDAIREQLLAALSEEEQRLYQMKYVDGASLREIGEVLQLTPGAVAARTSRLRKKIKGLVEPVIESYTKGGRTE